MKLIKYNTIDESFEYESLLRHIKHIIEYKDDSRIKNTIKPLERTIFNFAIEYNKIADDLAIQKAGPALSDEDIVGYIDKNDNAVKYDKINHDFVVYNPRSPRLITKTLHKKTYDQYLTHYSKHFKEELPENQK